MKHFLFATCLLSAFSLSSQKVTDTLRNQHIYLLMSAKMSTDNIISAIAQSPCAFQLGAMDLYHLKEQGVSDNVISAMLAKNNPGQISKTALKSDVVNSSTIEPGIYFINNNQLKKIEPNTYSQSKSGSGMLGSLTGGIAKTKMSSKVNGGNANLQIDNANPTFKFCLDKDNTNSFGNPNNWITTASSPNQFILVKFRTSKKSREVTTGSFGTYSGMTSGIDDNDKIPFKFEREASGLFTIHFESPLKKGEYGFIFVGAQNMPYGTFQQVFDFGIKS